MGSDNLVVINGVSEGNWLTFLRLKALSSSFSTAWIFLTLMMQRASFPEKQKLNTRQEQYTVTRGGNNCFKLSDCIKVFFSQN